MSFLLEFKGNLTIVAILFYLSNTTVVSVVVELEIKFCDSSWNPFLSEKSNGCFNKFLAGI